MTCFKQGGWGREGEHTYSSSRLCSTMVNHLFSYVFAGIWQMALNISLIFTTQNDYEDPTQKNGH